MRFLLRASSKQIRDIIRVADYHQVAVNDIQTFGTMVESLELISRLITRYAIFEELYIQRASTLRGELLKALVILYAKILTVLADATKYFRTSILGE